jgi:predicted dehydrogenase
VNIAIIGCGLIGQKRANTLVGARVAVCADSDVVKAGQVAAKFDGCVATGEWRRAIDRTDIHAVIVATPHNLLADIAACAIDAGKHVLVEKPAARHVDELRPLRVKAEKNSVLVHVGFNHRYHRAFRRARQIVDSGALGPLMFIRARYGHGGRLGYEKEWRARPEVSGGGELIDQGVHLIDLARWFLGEFPEVESFVHTYFWNMPVDDNAFMTLKTSHEQVAFLHASCTEWKNTFCFEIYGKSGKLQIDGLGGSYGTERLTFYKMLPEMGPPETTSWEFPMADDSWEVETAEFLEDVRLSRRTSVGLDDAIAALDIVDRIYRGSRYDHRS